MFFYNNNLHIKFEWCTIKTVISCIYCKIRKKGKKCNGMIRESQCRDFQNALLFRHVGLQEHQMANLCLQAIYPQAHLVNGLGVTIFGPGTRVFYWLCESQDSLQRFSRWITAGCIGEV